MRIFINLVDQFRRDERGVFGVIFGLLAIVLIAMSGAVVDYVTLEQARNRAQIAIDSAALALQPSIYSLNETQLKDKADDWLKDRITDPRITASVQSATKDEDEGSIVLTAKLIVPTTFVGLLGFTEFTPTVVSEATRKKLFVELALVLDNSGSMSSSSRMTNLKLAAKSATDILFDNQDTSLNTTIGVVPFNFWVNIGPGSATKSWMDQTGLSSASHDGFDDDDNENTPFLGPLNRFEIYNQMNDVSWAGCVEARPQPYDVTDAVPNIGVPDTLFVPTLSPDQPDNGNYPGDYIDDDPPACAAGGGASTRICEWRHIERNCDWQGNNCSGNTRDRYKATYPNGDIDNDDDACSCDGEAIFPGTTVNLNWQNNDRGYRKVTTRTCTDHYSGGGSGGGSSAGSLSDRELQERVCKYTNSTPINVGSNGPNAECVTTQVLPLSNSRTTVKARIDQMVANGATNIHQGAIWGFHLLSPTEPYTEGRAYDEATSKVMILMTDGQNTFYRWGDDSDPLNGASVYPPYGWPLYERLGDTSKTAGQMEDLVDARLLETCKNARDAGIVVYTVGLSSPNNVKNMLKACAGDDSRAKFPNASSELVTVFEEIAGQLGDLRLAK